MARPRKDGTPAKRPARGPIPSNDPPPGYLDPDIPVLTDAVPEGAAEIAVLHIAGNRVAFLAHFDDGLMPVVGRRYAFACYNTENGGPDETDMHSASFRLVRIY